MNLLTASKTEMKEYARDVLGLGITMAMSEETMRQRIKDKCDELGIDPPNDEILEAKKKRADERKKGWPTIMIPESEKPGGSEPVFVGYNGKGFTIPRNVDVQVPPPVLEILRNAKQDIITQDEEGNLHTKRVMTYPFQNIGV